VADIPHERAAEAELADATGRRERLALLSSTTVSRITRAACYVGVLTGIVLRLLQFLANRSLSQDEAMLALNIMHRSFSGLLHQLDFLQGAPQGFLILQKLAVTLLGSSEYSLRIVPFICGSLALVLILPLARETVRPIAVPLAVVFFAFSDPLINWTVYDKQYAVDVLMAVAVLWVGLRLVNRPQRAFEAVLFSVLGVAAIWLSHPSVFVLAGVSAALVVGALTERDWRRVLMISALCSPWLLSFGVFALTSLDELGTLQSEIGGGLGTYAGSGPPGSSTFTSLRGGFGQFRYVSGIPHVLEQGSTDLGLLIFLIAVAFCALGLFSLPGRRLEKQVAILAPLVLSLIAWSLDKYPLLGRTQLFLIPSFVLLLAEGMAFAATKPQRAWLKAAGASCSVVVTVAVVAPTLAHVTKPRRFEDLKPVLNYFAARQLPGDTTYVFYTAQYQLRYYMECGCAGSPFENARKAGLWPMRRGRGGSDEFAPALLSVPPRLIVAPFRGRDPQPYVVDFDALHGRKRVWMLFSSLEDDRRTFLLRQLNARGTPLMHFSVGRGKNAVAVYLYDMTHRGRRR
jgi:4-amino-4-deoxy-L-arabinose transferase-like glycosyltransferase